MLKINTSEKYYRPSTHSDGSSARVARVISNSWFSRLYRIPVGAIDGSESDWLKVAECAAPDGLGLDVAQRGDGMDDHLGEAGRKGAPVRGLGDTRLDCAGLENKKIWDTF